VGALRETDGDQLGGARQARALPEELARIRACVEGGGSGPERRGGHPPGQPVEQLANHLRVRQSERAAAGVRCHGRSPVAKH